MEDKIGDKFKKLVKKIVKKVVLMLAKPILIGVVIISVITTFLASAVYIVVGLEAQQDDGNIANVKDYGVEESVKLTIIDNNNLKDDSNGVIYSKIE